jgi:hypothetical protein
MPGSKPPPRIGSGRRRYTWKWLSRSQVTQLTHQIKRAFHRRLLLSFSSATLGTALKHAQTRTKSCPDTRGGAPLRLGLDDNPAASGAFRLPLNPRSDDLHRW